MVKSEEYIKQIENTLIKLDLAKECNLEENKITGDMFKDGGTMIYKYDSYTIIKCHTLGGNRDVYIGNEEMTINDISI